MNVMGSDDDDDDDIDNKNENITNNCCDWTLTFCSVFTLFIFFVRIACHHFGEIKVIWFMQPPGWEMYKING